MRIFFNKIVNQGNFKHVVVQPRPHPFFEGKALGTRLVVVTSMETNEPAPCFDNRTTDHSERLYQAAYLSKVFFLQFLF